MNAQQKQDLRHVCLEFLAMRHPTAHGARAVRRTVARELDFAIAEDEVTGILEFLHQLGLVRVELDPLGSTKYFAATPAGVLAHERGLQPQPPEPVD